MPHTSSRNTSQEKYIFWCHTDLPEEYIFIYSTSELGARRKYKSHAMSVNFFIEMEHIIAENICSIPPNVIKELKIKTNCGIASDELLSKIGIEYLTEDETVFRYNGKIYKESNVVINHLEINEFEAPSVYLFKLKDRNCFKIGISKNIARRKKEKTSPDQLDLICFINTPLARDLEKRILKQFRKFSLGKEFVGVDDWASDLLIITFNLYHLEYSKVDIDHVASHLFNFMIEKLDQLVQKHKLNTIPTKEDITIARAINHIINKHMEEKDAAILSNKLL